MLELTLNKSKEGYKPLIPKRTLLDERIHFALSAEEKRKIEAYALENGVSVSEAVRFMANTHLVDYTPNPDILPPKNADDLENSKVSYEMT